MIKKIINYDRIDRAILRELQSNARQSLQEISAIVGLSASSCARRIRHLEEQGLIAGYHALIDEAKAGFSFSVFVSVKLAQQVDRSLKEFEAEVRAYPEIVDCWLMTGNMDYLLRIAVRDTADFEAFLTGKLTKVPGVASIESSVPLRRVKAGISRSR